MTAFQELLYLELSLQYDREETREERREGRVEDCLSKMKLSKFPQLTSTLQQMIFKYMWTNDFF